MEHAYTHRISGSCTYKNVYTCMYAYSSELCLPHIVGKVCTDSILSTYTIQEHIVENSHTKSRKTQWRKYTCTYTIQRNTVVEVCTHTQTRNTQWRWRSVSCTHLVSPHISTTQGIFICQSCFFLEMVLWSLSLSLFLSVSFSHKHTHIHFCSSLPSPGANVHDSYS